MDSTEKLIYESIFTISLSLAKFQAVQFQESMDRIPFWLNNLSFIVVVFLRCLLVSVFVHFAPE